MSFDTERRKIQFIRNREISNQIKAARQKIENSLVNRDVIRISPNHSVFKKRRDLSFDWNPMFLATIFGGIEQLDTQYINWEVTFNRFDERLIPFMNVQILYRQAGGGDDGITLIAPNTITFFEIEDLPGSTYVKKVVLKASFYFGQVFAQPDVSTPYCAKLVITLTHHQDII